MSLLYDELLIQSSDRCHVPQNLVYRQISNINCTKSQNLNGSRVVLQLFLYNIMKPDVENEDVVGAAPVGDAPTTSEWSTLFNAY